MLFSKRVQWSDIKDTLTDVGIMGHLLITSIGLTPLTPLQTCKGEFHEVIAAFSNDAFLQTYQASLNPSTSTFSSPTR